MQQQFSTILTNQFSFLKGKKLLIACSGGVDSVVLAHLCVNTSLDVALAHCNFNLRGEESNADEIFVTELAKKYSIPVFTTHFDTLTYQAKGNKSTQMAARELRYRWFDEVLDNEGYEYVLTAHHADDALETFLINLSRGTGMTGLSGIPAVNNKIVRPLLQFSRVEIEDYANQQKLLWREDSSNASTKYIRNKLRLEVIPKLKEIHPEFLNNFLGTQKHLQESEQVLLQHMKSIKKKLFIKEEKAVKISTNALKELQPLNTYLFYLFSEFGFKQWQDIVLLIDAQSGKYVASETHRLIKDRDQLLLTKNNQADYETILVQNLDNQTVKASNLNLKFTVVDVAVEASKSVIYVDNALLKYPLQLRKYQEGDVFYPLGMKGKKKLSKYFKDEKYSMLDKENQWLLCSENNIVWVVGKRADERFKVTSKTQQILKVEIVD